MNNIALRIFYISDANERQNQVPLGCINGSTNPDVFRPKTFLIPRGIIPQNFISQGFAVSEELGNKQTD